MRSRGRLRLGVLAVACALAGAAAASAAGLRIRSDFGPENASRPRRAQTHYIVLHTTEGREAGSLRKLRQRGEAHYFVHRDGRVTRLIDRRRIATHAGRSLWDGRDDLDQFSIGIEVSGYHDQQPTQAQLTALRELLRQLQGLYDVPDERVLTHSMVAYGAPNRFHRRPHRGRKRCAMVFADPGVRHRLGLVSGPRRDPDVAAGRLHVADRMLQRRLYPPQPAQPAPAPMRRAAFAPEGEIITPERTAWSIAGSAHASPGTVYVFPDGSRVRGNEMREWGEIALGTRVLLDQTLTPAPAVALADAAVTQGVDGLLLVSQPIPARALLGPAAAAETTTYLFPSGSVRTGAELDRQPAGRRLLQRLPTGTRILAGYVNAGRLGRGQSPTRVAGSRWNEPSTYYRVPSGGIRSGTEIDASRVPAGTLIFFRQQDGF